MISGKTTLIAHIGFPTESFKAPMIYNPWFDKHGIDAAVIPMGVRPEDYTTSLKAIFRMSNVRGALVTMPHKVVTNALVDELTPTARIAGASNAVGPLTRITLAPRREAACANAYPIFPDDRFVR